ncbi:MAG: hypothetical protein IPG00_20245 [Saprospiraceae bacterium]|nr:hypothetical protein [Saprospiraceae bacterium]
MTEKDFGRHTILREQGVIADLEKKKQNQRFSMKRETLKLFRSQKLNNEVRI